MTGGLALLAFRRGEEAALAATELELIGAMLEWEAQGAVIAHAKAFAKVHAKKPKS